MAKTPGETPGNAPANVNEATGEIITTPDLSRPSYRFRDWVQSQAVDDGSDTWEVTAKQLDRMLMAETFEEIMDADETGTHQGRDLVDFEFEVVPGQRFRYAKTAPQFDAPLGIYLQFTVTAVSDFEPERIKTGEEIIVSTGAPLIIGKLRTLQANGMLDGRKFTVKSVPTPRGTALKLRSAPNRAVPGTAE